MGQYYYPISIDKKEYINNHRYGGGLKLMEHSYIGTELMDVVECLLSPKGKWYKTKIVWAGDYADEEKGHKFNLHTWILTIGLQLTPLRKKSHCRYIVNHTKKEYIDKIEVEKINNNSGLKIHPLSLLTAEGNGRGGGDFHGEDARIGTWARDVISMEKEIPEGYKKIDGNFVEET